MLVKTNIENNKKMFRLLLFNFLLIKNSFTLKIITIVKRIETNESSSTTGSRVPR